jgi:DNA-binding NarL/FixJ family response regulator
MDRDVRVLAVDDHEVFLQACQHLVAATDGFRWAGGATSGAQALTLVAQLAPDLVLVDVRMPGMDGLETTRQLLQRHPRAVVVLLSVEGPDDLPAGWRACGAAAHVRKQSLSPAALHRLWASFGPSEITA